MAILGSQEDTRRERGLMITVRCNGVERIIKGRQATIIRELITDRLRLDEIEHGRLIIDFFGNPGNREMRFRTERDCGKISEESAS